MVASAFGARWVYASTMGESAAPAPPQCTVGDGSVAPTPLGPVTSNATVSARKRNVADCDDSFLTMTGISTCHPTAKSTNGGVLTASVGGARSLGGDTAVAAPIVDVVPVHTFSVLTASAFGSTSRIGATAGKSREPTSIGVTLAPARSAAASRAPKQKRRGSSLAA